MLAQPQDEDTPVTIATYPNPHDAHLGRIALESQGIPAFVQSDHGQYASIASWVQLQVAIRDREFASEILEQGPFSMSEAESATSEDAPDDMRPVRLKRHFVLARWFLYASALTLLLTFWISGPLFLIPFGLALWSKKHPRHAFGSAYFLQILVLFLSISTSGLFGLTALIPLVAYYWAWTGAKTDPPEQLLASPFPKSPAIEIGQAWEGGDASREPTETPLWWVRGLGLFAFVVVLIWAIRQALRFG
jgi:hypothetical protein